MCIAFMCTCMHFMLNRLYDKFNIKEIASITHWYIPSYSVIPSNPFDTLSMRYIIC